MSTDDVTAFLADVRMQAEDHHLVPADMVLPLLAFAEAALKLADGWKQEFARLEPSGADAVSNANPGSYLVSGRLGALEDCAEGLREAITAALAGKAPQSPRDTL